MATLYDSRFLNSARLQTIIETRASDLERMRPLLYLDRLTLVNAADDEIMGRFTARQLTADIIADDQKAIVYEGGQVETVINQLANIKLGQNVSQSQLNMMERLRNGQSRAAEEDALLDWEQRFGEALLQAVRERMNMMALAMMIDRFDYERWGIKLSNVTWGMPALLKVTPSALWSTDNGATVNASAVPITDLLNMDNVDADNYGVGAFDRITMSTAAFNLLTGTTQFLNRAQMFTTMPFQLTAGQLQVEDRQAMVTLAGKIMNKEIQLDDKTYREVSNNGSQRTRRVLPANKVLLDRKQNGASEWDFGNAVVTESVVAGLLNNVTLGANPRMNEGGAYGPLGYYTAQDASLNPPGVNGWAVARGFPRKHVIECSAVLTIY